MGRRRRLDDELVRRGLVPDVETARDAIADGRVTVDGAPAMKPVTLVEMRENLVVAAPAATYVSRGGDKLEGALGRLRVDPTGRRCLDVGASTGGFVDCLLQHGAAQVTAVDVGYGIIDYHLREDPRVTVVERTNARNLTLDDLGGDPVDLAVGDLSFISVTAVLGALRACTRDGGEAIVLVKPQFEARREAVEAGGVVRDPVEWTHALTTVADAATRLGWRPVEAVPSPLTGPAGNVEFFLHLDTGAEAVDVRASIDTAVDEARSERGANER